MVIGIATYYQRPSVEKMEEIETVEAEKMGWLDLPRWHTLPHFPLRTYIHTSVGWFFTHEGQAVDDDIGVLGRADWICHNNKAPKARQLDITSTVSRTDDRDVSNEFGSSSTSWDLSKQTRKFPFEVTCQFNSVKKSKYDV